MKPNDQVIDVSSTSPSQALIVSWIDYGQPVGKGYSLDEQGTLKKESRSFPPCGKPVAQKFSSWEEYCDFRRSTLDMSNIVFLSGNFQLSHPPDESNVIYKAAKDQERSQNAEDSRNVCRTKEYLIHEAVPGVLRFDVDVKDPGQVSMHPGQPRVFQSADELLNAFNSAIPGFCDLAAIVLSSTSSCIYCNNKEMRGAGGWRVEVPIDDASQIPRVLDVIHKRLVLKGYGWAYVNAGGGIEERSPVDLAFKTATQPDFAAADLAEGLAYRRVFEDYSGEMLKAESVNPLTSQEEREVRGFYDDCRDALSSAIKSAKKAAYRKRKQHLLESGCSLEEVSHSLNALDQTKLLEHESVRFPENGIVKIRELLDDGSAYDECDCFDPIEPDYDGGRLVAQFYWNEGLNPGIHTFAHGGNWYPLMYDDLSLKEEMDQGLIDGSLSIDRLVRRLGLGYLTSEAERGALLKRLAKLVGATKKDLERDINAFAAERRESSLSRDGDTNLIESLEYIAAKELMSEQYILCVGDQLWRYTQTHWETYHDTHAEQDLVDKLGRDGWASSLSPITLAAARSRQSLKQQAFTTNSPIHKSGSSVINCLNTELWIDGNGIVESRSHSPDSGLVHVLPVEYDPSARSPLFQPTVKEWFMPPAQEWVEMSDEQRANADRFANEMCRHTLEAMAYAIVPNRFITTWLMLYGPGSNGKTMFTQILQCLLPESAVEVEQLDRIANNEHGMARVIGKTLVIDDDLSAGTVLPDGILKLLSEEKTLSANPKNKESVSFKNRALLVLLTNTLPKIRDVSPGFRRRMHVIPFRRRFYKLSELEAMPAEKRTLHTRDRIDLDRLPALKGELSGVLNELLEAYQRLRRRGDFEFPKPVTEMTERIFREAHPLKFFVDECCTVGSHLWIERTEFQRALRDYLREEGMRWNPSAQQIKQQLESLGFKCERRKVEGKTREVFLSLQIAQKGMSERLNDLSLVHNQKKSPRSVFR